MNWANQNPTAAAAPIWRQISDGMRRLVASGVLPAGTAVPSVRELARELRVNPATVSKAYQLLVADGALDATLGTLTHDEERRAKGLEQVGNAGACLCAAGNHRVSNAAVVVEDAVGVTGQVAKLQEIVEEEI